MGGTNPVFAPNLPRAGPSDLSGPSGDDDLLLQRTAPKHRLDLKRLIFKALRCFVWIADIIYSGALPPNPRSLSLYGLPDGQDEKGAEESSPCPSV